MSLADTIKLKIEVMLCPKHDIYPMMDISGNEIQITCCCTAFHEACTVTTRKMLSEMDAVDWLLSN